MHSLLARCAGLLSLAAAAFASAPVAAATPIAPHIYFPSNPSPLDYCSPGMATHGNQLCNVFLPLAAPKDVGYPVLISMSLGGFTGTSLIDQIDNVNPLRDYERFFAACLDRGIAVVQCTATISGQLDLNGTPIPGQGIFYPPGMTLPGSNTPLYESRKRHFSEKDAVMIMQYVRHHAGLAGGLLSYINPDRIAVHGRSAGAFSMHWIGFGPDRAAQTFPNPSDIGWETTSTVPNAVIVEDGATWVPAFGQSFSAAGHFPDQSQPSMAAATLADVDECLQVAVSAHDYVPAGFSRPTLMHYEHSHVSNQVQIQGYGCAQPLLPFSTETLIHSRFSGLSWKERFPTTYVIIQAPVTGVPSNLFDVEINSDPQRARLMADWLLKYLP